MSLKQITKTQFQQAVQGVTELLNEEQPSLDTKKGSVINELIIRPFAFCYAKVTQFLDQWITKASFSNLENSMQTSDQVADALASNFFVTRKSGTYATGYITITSSSSNVRIPSKTVFLIDGYTFYTTTTYIITLDKDDYTDTTSCRYLKPYQVLVGQNTLYRFNIPVQAAQPGSIQIPRGVQVLLRSQIPFIQTADILSPITGGFDVQTTASMIERCKNRVINSIGTLNSFLYKLQKANSSITSCNIIGSDNPLCTRASLNPFGIYLPGFIDIYAKTTNQVSSTIVTKVCSAQITQAQTNLAKLLEIQSYSHCIQLDQAQHAALIAVKSVLCSSAQRKFTVVYAYDGYEDDLNVIGENTLQLFKQKQMAFRLSPLQKTLIFVQADEVYETTDASIQIQYMPDIDTQNSFLKANQEGFIGLNTLVKSALPVKLAIKAYIKSKNDISIRDLEQIKNKIAHIINSLPVGTSVLNLGQISHTLQTVYPEIRLQVPYVITAMLQTFKGVYTGINSETGIIDLKNRNLYQGIQSPQIYFFSITPLDIDLQVV